MCIERHSNAVPKLSFKVILTLGHDWIPLKEASECQGHKKIKTVDGFVKFF